MRTRIILAVCVALLALGAISRRAPHGTDFYTEVAKGSVPGHTAVIVYGENTDIPAGNVFEVLWDGSSAYVNPVAAVLHNVASTDVDDVGTVVSSGTATGGSLTTLEDTEADFVSDGVAVGDSIVNDENVEIGVITSVDDLNNLSSFVGMSNPDSGLRGPPADTPNPQIFAHPNEEGDAYRIVAADDTGASLVYIVGHSVFRTEIDEFVVLNGQTDVPTVNLYARQYRMRVFGSNESEGAITSTTDDVATTVTAQINADSNQSLMTPYSCPITHTCYITYWWGALSKGVGATTVSIIHLMGGTLGAGVPYKLQPRSYTSTASSGHEHPYFLPVPFPGGADLWMMADSTTNGTGVSGGYYLINVEN